MSMQAEPLWNDFGLAVDCAGADRPSDLDLAGLREAVRRYGVVVLRRVGAAASTEEAARWLTDFAAAFLDRVIAYPGRNWVRPDGEVQRLMDVRTRGLQFHTEHAWHPLQPDLGIFMCVSEAREPGGETALAHGARLLAALPERTRQAFRERRIRYVSHLGSRWWRTYHREEEAGPVLARLNALPGVRAAAVDRRLLARYFECELLEDEVLRVEYLAPAVIAGVNGPCYTGSPHRHDYSPFLAGIRYGKSRGELGVWATFEDGGEIGEPLRLDVDRACEQHAAEWTWRRGDVALIDNWSVLHGRLRTGGEGRQLLSAWGHLAPLRPAAAPA
jgi:alpha-ketoglutarate-dependent taurine dioxygenase